MDWLYQTFLFLSFTIWRLHKLILLRIAKICCSGLFYNSGINIIHRPFLDLQIMQFINENVYKQKRLFNCILLHNVFIYKPHILQVQNITINNIDICCFIIINCNRFLLSEAISISSICKIYNPETKTFAAWPI